MALDQVTSESTLAGLLKLLLSLPSDEPIYATPSFDEWLPSDQTPTWPPEAAGGLWLVDTRDRAGRRLLANLDPAGDPGFRAALILTGSGIPGSRLRRLLRRLRRPGTRRLPERRVTPALDPLPPEIRKQRLGFRDGPRVPDDFAVGGEGSTGAAFLLTRGEPFGGPLWTSIGARLGGGPFQLLAFQLRVRGAAVLMIRQQSRQVVVRLVPETGPQEVVLRNHSALEELRRSIRQDQPLLDLIPAPLFADRVDSVLMLGETRLAGTLAWKVAAGGLGAVIHDNALAFLHALRTATTPAAGGGAFSVDAALAPDRERLRSCTFVDPDVRSMLARELDQAARALNGVALDPHASHGDFGYGNILVDPGSGELEGVIDWDTARPLDFPGIDRVNLEIQIRPDGGFGERVSTVWKERAAYDALQGDGGEGRVRALFGLGVARFVLRSLTYPKVYRRQAPGFRRALRWLSRVDAG